MAPEYDPQETTWAECVAQELATLSLRQTTCGATTHEDLAGTCRYCGAAK
jgi:hypothetical protein